MCREMIITKVNRTLLIVCNTSAGSFMSWWVEERRGRRAWIHVCMYVVDEEVGAGG